MTLGTRGFLSRQDDEGDDDDDDDDEGEGSSGAARVGAAVVRGIETIGTNDSVKRTGADVVTDDERPSVVTDDDRAV